MSEQATSSPAAAVPAACSKLRLSAVKSNGRLLKGYGPLAALLVAFVLMATAGADQGTPTGGRARDRRRAPAPGPGATPATGGAAGPARARPAARRERRAARPVAAGAAGRGQDGGLGRRRGDGQVGHAARARPQQVPGDPYSPPCISFSGSNGGRHVGRRVAPTRSTSRYRITSDSESFQQTLASLGGANITDTTADIERTVSALATYFDNHFQFYGRKLNIEFFNGQGSITNELLGSGQQQADADAVTSAQQLHAFAELNGVTEPYDVALAAAARRLLRGALPVGLLHGPVRPVHVEPRHRVQRRGRRPPASSTSSRWPAGTPTTPAAACRASRARWRSSPRATPGTRRRRSRPCRQAHAAGHPITDNIQYQLNLSTLSSQASNVISQLQNDGITTVFCGCDPVFPVYLTSRAAEQGYTPEWVVAGVALTDQDIVGQLFQQSEWSHAFGVSFNGPTRAQAEHVRLRRLQADQPEQRAGQRGRPHLRPDVRDGHRASRWPAPTSRRDVRERHAGLSGQPGRRPQCALRDVGLPGRALHAADGLVLHLLEPEQDVALRRQAGRLRGLHDPDQDRLLRRRRAAAALGLPDDAAVGGGG